MKSNFYKENVPHIKSHFNPQNHFKMILFLFFKPIP